MRRHVDQRCMFGAKARPNLANLAAELARTARSASKSNQIRPSPRKDWPTFVFVLRRFSAERRNRGRWPAVEPQHRREEVGFFGEEQKPCASSRCSKNAISARWLWPAIHLRVAATQMLLVTALKHTCIPRNWTAVNASSGAGVSTRGDLGGSSHAQYMIAVRWRTWADLADSPGSIPPHVAKAVEVCFGCVAPERLPIVMGIVSRVDMMEKMRAGRVAGGPKSAPEKGPNACPNIVQIRTLGARFQATLRLIEPRAGHGRHHDAFVNSRSGLTLSNPGMT